MLFKNKTDFSNRKPILSFQKETGLPFSSLKAFDACEFSNLSFNCAGQVSIFKTAEICNGVSWKVNYKVGYYFVLSYIGQTGHAFHKRINGHNFDFRSQSKDKGISEDSNH